MLAGNILTILVGSGFELSLTSTLVFSKKENIGRNQFKRSFSHPKRLAEIQVNLVQFSCVIQILKMSHIFTTIFNEVEMR